MTDYFDVQHKFAETLASLDPNDEAKYLSTCSKAMGVAESKCKLYHEDQS